MEHELLLGDEYQNMEWDDFWKGIFPDPPLESKRGVNPNLQGPAVKVWYPVFSQMDSPDRQLVGMLSLSTKWESFFLAHLPPDVFGLIVVVSNTCGQSFTFDITGTTANYLGPEDIHEEEYEYYQETYGLEGHSSMYTGTRLSTSFCPYQIDVYPSLKMRNKFATDNPRSFTVGVACIFCFTIVVFIFYDSMVERRQKFLADAADKSNAIVSALFPKIVRDRLFDEAKETARDKKNEFKNRGSMEGGMTAVDAGTKKSSAPIADLFANTTVMFGDIAGFTAWSSSRQPSEVFILLETLYGAFDKLAREMEVFKVETIGDCYMAVTGLPNAQDDHHIRMVSTTKTFMCGSLHTHVCLTILTSISRFGLLDMPCKK